MNTPQRAGIDKGQGRPGPLPISRNRRRRSLLKVQTGRRQSVKLFMCNQVSTIRYGGSY